MSSTKINESEMTVIVIEQDKSKTEGDDDVMYLKISKGELNSNPHIRQYLGYGHVKKEPDDKDKEAQCEHEPAEQTIIQSTQNISDTCQTMSTDQTVIQSTQNISDTHRTMSSDQSVFQSSQ